jgi:antirestriction protein ArdC
MKPRHDIYATVTAQLVAAIEAGAGEWRMPWHHSGAPVMRPTSVAGRRYSGINRLVLWATADVCGYAGIWATYQQWRAHGGQVRKGEIGTHVILWKKVERGDAATEVDGEGDSRARFFARSFVVFNRDQVDGADEASEKEVALISTSVADALAFLEGLGVPVEYGLHDAYYRPDIDKVFMPERTAFDHDLDLVSTLAHEVGNIASVLVAGGAGEGAVERYLRHLHCGEQSPGGGRLDARTAAGAATQRCGVIGIAAGASGIRRRLPASRSSAVLAR